MTDLAELTSLSADLRAWLAAADARGWRTDPVGDLPVGDLPVGDLPVGDLPVGDLPVGDLPVAAVAPSPAEPLAGWARLAAAARDARDPARELRLVRDDIGDCRRCNLCRDRTGIVFGGGDPSAQLVLVGPGPGYLEDQRGEPFLGEAGDMLDKMLGNVLGLSRAEVYLLHVVKCRPPKDRPPAADELAACRPFLERQLQAIGPKVIVALGSVAAGALFGSADPGARGRWQEVEGVPALATFHPAHLLRTPADKRLAFEDLKAVRQRYDALGGRRSAFKLS